MKFYDKQQSKAVLKICDQQGRNIGVYYSSLKDDRKGLSVSVNGLRRRIIKQQFIEKNQTFGVASIYKNRNATGSDDLLARYNSKNEMIEHYY